MFINHSHFVSIISLTCSQPSKKYKEYSPSICEGLIGGIHTFTRSHIRENRLADPIASGTEQYDWAMMVQVGAGILVPLNSTRDTFLEVKLNYVDSGQMDYLTRSSASYIEPGELVLSPKRSGFNMLQPSVALRINLD